MLFRDVLSSVVPRLLLRLHDAVSDALSEQLPLFFGWGVVLLKAVGDAVREEVLQVICDPQPASLAFVTNPYISVKHEQHLVEEEEHMAAPQGELVRDALHAAGRNRFAKAIRQSLDFPMLCQKVLISQSSDIYGGIDACHG